MPQTLKTVFRLCLTSIIFLITEKNFSQKQSFTLKSTPQEQFVLVSNNQNPDNAVFVLIATYGYVAKISCKHHLTDLCNDQYNKSHTRQISQAHVIKAGQWFYIQNVAYRDNHTGKTKEFKYSDMQIQQFYQDDVSMLKYTVFGIGLFSAIALYVSSRILRNFRRFITK
jgi:hypothetical protein